nr:hypothetical protein [Tanacetum cinerariifolium]
MCQTFQEKFEELKSKNESLIISVQKLTKSCKRGKAKLKQRDEMISALRKKLRLLEEQSEVFHKENNDLRTSYNGLKETYATDCEKLKNEKDELKMHYKGLFDLMKRKKEIINPDFDKIDSPFQQTSSLKPYVPTMILEKIIINLEDEVVSLLEKEKPNLETIESLKSKGFESSENAISESENQSENDCQVVEKECDQVENSKVIAPGIFKLSVSQSVSAIYVTKTSCASKNVENKIKRKRRKRISSKQNGKQVNNDVLRANNDFVRFSDLDTFSSVRRPKHSGVIWKKKMSSSTSNVDLSSVSHSKLNKDVK